MYKKQNFRPGEVLSAAQMDHIEEGLVEIEKNVIETLEDVKNMSVMSKKGLRTSSLRRECRPQAMNLLMI